MNHLEVNHLVRKTDLFLIGICIFTIYTLSNFDFGIQSLAAHDEGLYAGRAKLILETNDWFTPFDSPHHKTIGSYWLIALSFKLFGYSEFAARLPSIVFSTLCSLVIFSISRNYISRKASLITCLLPVSMPLWFQYSRYASPDITFVFLILLALNLHLIARKKDHSDNIRNLLLIFIGILIALAFFIRSFMVFLPIFSLIPYFLSIPKKEFINQFRFISLGLLIGLTPTFLLLKISIARFGPSSVDSLIQFAQGKTLGSNLLGDLLAYPSTLLPLAYPAIILSALGLTQVLSSRNRELTSLLLGFPLISFLILSISSTKYTHYSLILYPFLAILAGVAIDKAILEPNIFKYYNRRLFVPLTSFFGTLLILIGLLGPQKFSIPVTDEFEQIRYFVVLLGSINIIYVISVTLIKSKFVNTLTPFLGLCLVQILGLVYLNTTAIVASPNKNLKIFLDNPSITYIKNTHNIRLYRIEGKLRTLLRFYLSNHSELRDLTECTTDCYVISTSYNLPELINNKEYNSVNILTTNELSLIKVSPN